MGEKNVPLGKPWKKQGRNEGESQATEFSSPFLHILLPGLQGKSYQEVRVIEVKNNLTITRGEWGGDSGEKGLQELL